jgi:NADH dehydrogenase/NADH:ubiquinone oxidoreductase subunit G
VVVGEGENELADLAHRQFKSDEIEQAIALAQGAEMPVVVYGAAAGDVLLKLRKALSGKAQFLGLVPGTNGRGALAAGVSGSFEPDGVKAAFILSADGEVDETLLNELEPVDFVAVQASYSGPLVERADVVLPTAMWAEKSGTLVNTEGRAQPLNAALRPPAGVKDDAEILRALAEKLGA